MKDKEIREYLLGRRQKMNRIMQEFEYHSRQFDKKLIDILSHM